MNAEEIRSNLDSAQTIQTGQLNELFGNIKKASDDHPILNAMEHVESLSVNLRMKKRKATRKTKRTRKTKKTKRIDPDLLRWRAATQRMRRSRP